MRWFRLKLVIVLGALAVGACDRPTQKDAAGNNAVAQPPSGPPPEVAVNASDRQTASATLDDLETVDAAPKPAAPDPAAVTRSWFVGRWTDTGDCADAGEFAANGTYRLANGTRGMWNVADGRLVIQHAEGRSAVQVRRADDSTIEIVNEDGSTGRSTRC